jgi:hypothetical protein
LGPEDQIPPALGPPSGVSDARKAQLQTYLNSLYTTGRSDIDNAVATIRGELTSAMNNGEFPVLTTMDVASGIQAVAVALTTMPPRDRFSLQDVNEAVFIPSEGAGKDPAFTFKVNGEFVKSATGQRLLYNRHGGLYSAGDYRGNAFDINSIREPSEQILLEEDEDEPSGMDRIEDYATNPEHNANLRTSLRTNAAHAPLITPDDGRNLLRGLSEGFGAIGGAMERSQPVRDPPRRPVFDPGRFGNRMP